MAGKDPISPKVTFATGGSVGGYTIGKAISTILFYFVGPLPPDVTLAIEYIMEMGLGAAGAFVAGYYKAD